MFGDGLFHQQEVLAMPEPEDVSANEALNVLRSIAEGQHQQIATQRDLSESTKANTLSIQELTLTIERQRGEMNTRFQGLEDRIGHVETVQAKAEEDLRETRKRTWAVVLVWLGAAASWLGSHWPFHFSPPPHGR